MILLENLVNQQNILQNFLFWPNKHSNQQNIFVPVDKSRLRLDLPENTEIKLC